jgi:hypothetical protein
LVCFKFFKEKIHVHVHTKENAKWAKLIRGVQGFAGFHINVVA